MAPKCNNTLCLDLNFQTKDSSHEWTALIFSKRIPSCFQASIVQKIVVSHIRARVNICHFFITTWLRTEYIIIIWKMSCLTPAWRAGETHCHTKTRFETEVSVLFPPARSGNEIKTWRWCHAISTKNKQTFADQNPWFNDETHISSGAFVSKSDPRFVICIISYYPKPDRRLLFERLDRSTLVGFSRHQQLVHKQRRRTSNSVLD